PPPMTMASKGLPSGRRSAADKRDIGPPSLAPRQSWILVYENTSKPLSGRRAPGAIGGGPMDRLRGLSGAAMPKPQTAADQVAGILREAIADGSLPAGTPLRQDDLATRFGFSRMPVRDALRQLEAEGIVSIHPTRGAFVARMDAEEIREIYAIR